MTIQQITIGTVGAGGGDPAHAAFKKINDNFTTTPHAASRLVGTAVGNVMEVGAFGIGTVGAATPHIPFDKDLTSIGNGFYTTENGSHTGLIIRSAGNLYNVAVMGLPADAREGIGKTPYYYVVDTRQGETLRAQSARRYEFYTTFNVTKDADGILRGKSPVTRLFSDRIEHQGSEPELKDVEFVKKGVGDYLLKNTTGFAKEGWYINTPKDANGNVLVAVVYNQLSNNDISVKTYAKKFDDETGDIVANLAKPRDIPDGRWIDLRLHELPRIEVMNEPTE